MPSRIRRIAPEVCCFLLVAAVYLAHFVRAGYDRFYFDSARYWRLGDRFSADGGFSLLAYDDRYRGYSLPLLNRGLDVAGSTLGIGGVAIVHLSGALLAATLGVVVLPRLARALFSNAEVGWGRVLALNGLVFLFWRDHLGFPLSDFPAVLAACVALLGLLRATFGGYVVAGVGFALAANMRPAYAVTAVAAIVVAALSPLRPWGAIRHLLAPALVVAGALVVLLPQAAMNHRHHDSWSPTVAAARQITMAQLTYGLQVQKWDTYVGPPGGYPRPEVFYLDPFARPLLRDSDLPITSYDQYARIAVRNPLRMAASYGAHVFNGLDVRYPTPYVRDLRDSPVVLSLLLYTLVFVAAARLALPEARRRLGSISWIGVTLMVSPVLTVIPGVIDPRYFLPVHLLVYMLVAFAPDAGSLLAGSTSRRIGLAVSYAAFVFLCLGLSSAMQAQIQHPLGAAGQVAADPPDSYRRSSISSGPARATTTKPARSSSGRASGTAFSLPISPV